jgi:Ca-activated chloride channel family protein
MQSNDKRPRLMHWVWAICLAGIIPSLVLPSLGSPQQDNPNEHAPGCDFGKSLVRLTVTVTDKNGRSVEKLQPRDFTILVKDEPQKLVHFCGEEQPSSVGILLDTSGSMFGRDKRDKKNLIHSVKETILHFIEQGLPGNEYFLVAFSQHQELIADWTNNKNVIGESLGLLNLPKGPTAVHDALYFGLEKVRQRTNRKQVLILITDGDDNTSKHGFEEVAKLTEASDVLVYLLCLTPQIEMLGPNSVYSHRFLKELSSAVGGDAFFPANARQFAQALDVVAFELRHQYSLGFQPTSIPDGKWRRIKVEVRPIVLKDQQNGNAAPKLTKVSVRTRAGYMAAR